MDQGHSHAISFSHVCSRVLHFGMNYCEVAERSINYENVRTNTMNHSYCRSPPSICLSYLSQSPISLLRLLISTFPPFAFRSSHFALWPRSSLSSLCCSGTFLPLWLRKSLSIIFLSKLNIRSTPIELWIERGVIPLSPFPLFVSLPLQCQFKWVLCSLLSSGWWGRDLSYSIELG